MSPDMQIIIALTIFALLFLATLISALLLKWGISLAMGYLDRDKEEEVVVIHKSTTLPLEGRVLGNQGGHSEFKDDDSPPF